MCSINSVKLVNNHTFSPLVLMPLTTFETSSVSKVCKVCACCQKPLTEKQIKEGNKFCSSSCSASYNNKKRPSKLTKTCKCCGTLIPKSRTYCSTCYEQVKKQSPVNKKYFTKEEVTKANTGYLTKTRTNNKEFLVEYLGGECLCCGYKKNIKALEFHHLNPNEKEFTISNKSNWSKQRLIQEADKCVLLCANCHREVHDELLTNPDLNNQLAKMKEEKMKNK